MKGGENEYGTRETCLSLGKDTNKNFKEMEVKET
jgi:hypothetical protein